MPNIQPLQNVPEAIFDTEDGPSGAVGDTTIRQRSWVIDCQEVPAHVGIV